MKPYIRINKSLNKGIIFSSRCGSTSIREWSGRNGYDSDDKGTAYLYGVIRNPQDRFVSSMLRYMTSPFEEVPIEVEDRLPFALDLMTRDSVNFKRANIHFISQVEMLNKQGPANEYWLTENLDQHLPGIKRINPGIHKYKPLVESQLTPDLMRIIHLTYLDDFRLYNKVKK